MHGIHILEMSFFYEKVYIINNIISFSYRLVFTRIKKNELAPYEEYNLKNNYKLMISDKIYDGTHKYEITLTKGNHSVLIDTNTYFNNLKYYPRYEGIDFDNYFVITFFYGGYTDCVFEKKTGNLIIEFDSLGSKKIYDISAQLVIYNIKNNEEDFFPRDIILYDLNNNKKHYLNEKLTEERNKQLFWLNILNWYISFEFGVITPNSIEIIFSGCYKPIFDKDGEFIDAEDYRFSFKVLR